MKITPLPIDEYMRLLRKGEQDKAVAILVEKVDLGALKKENKTCRTR